jgi:hypothetical protein
VAGLLSSSARRASGANPAGHPPRCSVSGAGPRLTVTSSNYRICKTQANKCPLKPNTKQAPARTSRQTNNRGQTRQLPFVSAPVVRTLQNASPLGVLQFFQALCVALAEATV